MKAKKIIPPGTRYGKLTVIREVGLDKNSHRLFECECDCGSVKQYTLINLQNRKSPTRSCGCARGLRDGVKSGSREKLYKTYINMKQRCNNPNTPNFHNYGGRGISVCEEWENDYNAFRKWAYEAGYKPGCKRELTLDRIDNNGNYAPSNCRWVNMEVQSNNKRENVRITYNGETHTLSEWSRITGLNRGQIEYRYKKGYPLNIVFCEGILNPKRNSYGRFEAYSEKANQEKRTSKAGKESISTG